MCRSCLELLPGVPLSSSVMFDPHMPWLSALRVACSASNIVTQHSDVHPELPLSSALCVVAADRFIVMQHSDVHLEWALSSALCVVATDQCLLQLSHAPPHPHPPYHDALSRSAARLQCHFIMHPSHLMSCAFAVSTRTVELSCRGGWAAAMHAWALVSRSLASLIVLTECMFADHNVMASCPLVSLDTRMPRLAHGKRYE